MSVFVILTPGFPVNEQDTTCLPAFQQFALSLKKTFSSHEFIFISFQYPFQEKEYYWNGIKVFAIGGANKPGINRLKTWIKAYRRLQSIRKEKQISGLISLWLTECSFVGKYFANFNGIRHYMWLIGQDAKSSNQYIKRIRPKGNQIIAMSDFLQEEYSKNHKQRPFLVAENGIIASAFPPLNSGFREIDILGVGSLIPLKNYTLFLEIITELKKSNPHLKAVLAGSGIEEPLLKEKVNRLGLQDTVTFAGLVSHTEVFDLMSKSKVFLHTSTYEGNSTVLMEALYSGCYTVSTCPLSNREIKNLSILKTKVQFVESIELQLKNEQAAYQRVVFNTMDATAKKIIDLFQ